MALIHRHSNNVRIVKIVYTHWLRFTLLNIFFIPVQVYGNNSSFSMHYLSTLLHWYGIYTCTSTTHITMPPACHGRKYCPLTAPGSLSSILSSGFPDLSSFLEIKLSNCTFPCLQSGDIKVYLLHLQLATYIFPGKVHIMYLRLAFRVKL